MESQFKNVTAWQVSWDSCSGCYQNESIFYWVGQMSFWSKYFQWKQKINRLFLFFQELVAASRFLPGTWRSSSRCCWWTNGTLTQHSNTTWGEVPGEWTESAAPPWDVCVYMLIDWTSVISRLCQVFCVKTILIPKHHAQDIANHDELLLTMTRCSVPVPDETPTMMYYGVTSWGPPETIMSRKGVWLKMSQKRCWPLSRGV